MLLPNPENYAWNELMEKDRLEFIRQSCLFGRQPKIIISLSHTLEEAIYMVSDKKENRIAFRANEEDLALINALQKSWQYSTISAVLHKMCAEYRGNAARRQKTLDKIKELCQEIELQPFECPVCSKKNK